MAACVRLPVMLLLVLAVLILYGDLVGLLPIDPEQPQPCLKVASIDQELQHYKYMHSTKVASVLFFLYTYGAEVHQINYMCV